MPDFLDTYKPSVSITQNFEVDESLPDNELSFLVLKNLVKARTLQDLTFIVMGKLLKLVRDKKLYTHLDFDNFSQFLASEELSFSREKAYLLIRTYEIYVEQLDFNQDELGKMGIAKLMILTPLIKDIKDKDEAVKKIEEMKDLRYGDFVRQVKQETNLDGKPEVFYSNEINKWFVRFYDNTTELQSLGSYEKNPKT